MFLKVRGPEEDEGLLKAGTTDEEAYTAISQFCDDWWIFECYKIHYHKEWYRMPLKKKWKESTVSLTSHKEKLEEDDEEENWGNYIDGDEVILRKDVGSNPRQVIVAHLSTEESQDYVVVFDTKAYLCNNQGETIEKIEP